MNHVKSVLPPGLWFVGVPIGTARDITLRALDVLASADVLAAEDSRSLRKLMDIHGIPLAGRRIRVLHEHSKPDAVSKLIEMAQMGQSVAYASEAGMPAIADPGFELARAAHAAGVAVDAAPGPTAVVTALTLAGLPTDAFHFAGFLPTGKSARRAALKTLSDVKATLVLYESPKRVAALLSDAADVLGSDRDAALCRELTKKFQEVQRSSLGALSAHCASNPPRGEIVVLIGRGDSENVSQKLVDDALSSALNDMSVKDAVAAVTEAFGLSRRDVYQRALEIDKQRKA